MSTKPKLKAKSRLLEVMHETAGNLHRLGFIDKRKMGRMDFLCLVPAQDYDAKKVKALRDRLRLSQSALADVLGASASTVRQWEAGDKHPSGPSRRLLDILDRKGIEAVL
jgi:putative transcriptional regulator